MRSSNILNTIRLKNIINMIFPSILLVLLIMYYVNSHTYNIMFPIRTNKLSDLYSTYSQGYNYVNVTVDTLYDSGLDCVRNGKQVGRYYYAFENNYCYFFLISNKQLDSYVKKNGSSLSTLDNITVNAAIQNNPKVMHEIIAHVSHGLSWTHTGMDNSTSGYIISEPDFPFIKTLVIFIILLVLTIISALFILYSLVCICCPYLYKSVIKLRHYGKIREHIRLANDELKQDLLLNDGHFIITRNYLMIRSIDDFQIIPLNNIVWAYKFSSYRPFKYKNRKITYTLCIYGKHNVSLISPHNLKTNTDNVLECLHNHYPDILIGYSREYEHIAKLKM